MNRGYVKLWRKIEDGDVFPDPRLLQVWIYCLLRANHEVRTVPVNIGRGYATVKLKPGQFLFGRHAAAKDLKCPPSTVRNKIDSLRRRKMLDIQPDTHFSIVTIRNWNIYQADAEELGQATGQASGQASDTDKNYKNYKKRSTAAAAKDAGPSAGKILGYDTIGRPLYAEPAASEAAR